VIERARRRTDRRAADPTVQRLTAWARGFRFDDLDPDTVEVAKAVVLDLLGAAAGGRETRAATAVRRYVSSSFASGSATVWWGDDRRTAVGTVLANSAAGAALDVDDGHRRASGHPGAAIVPAVIAAAEHRCVRGRELLAAIVVGYEVAVRAGAAFRRRPSDTISTGHWCALGVAAAVGRLVELSEDELASAIATAWAFSPRLVELGSHAHDVKEGIAWATHAGMAAVELASGGLAGPLHGIDDGAFDIDALVRGLGTEPLLIRSTYFKPYACCRWAHSAVDASLMLAEEARVPASTIDEVRIDTFRRATTLFNEPDPSTVEAAQYSIPFCVSAALLHGRDALLPMEPALLGSPSVVSLAERVRLRVDPELDARFPDTVPARVTLRSGDRSWTRFVEVPLGDPANPLRWDDLVEKFRVLAGRSASGQQLGRVVAAIMSLATAPSVAPLMALVRAERPPAASIAGRVVTGGR
jgi:2-methylcitrate dehydratase PrpD